MSKPLTGRWAQALLAEWGEGCEAEQEVAPAFLDNPLPSPLTGGNQNKHFLVAFFKNLL